MLTDLSDSLELSLAEKVFQALKKGIVTLEIKPRQTLIIGDVAEHYHISRTPVREAFIKLEREGWVEKDGRRGVKVTIPSEDSLIEMVETQAALESFAAATLASKGISDLFKEDLTELLRDTEIALRNHDERLPELMESFSTLLYRELGNEYLRKMVSELEEKTSRVRMLSLNLGPAPYAKSHEQHKKIAQAIFEGDPQDAYKMMFHHTTWFEEGLLSLLQNY